MSTKASIESPSSKSKKKDKEKQSKKEKKEKSKKRDSKNLETGSEAGDEGHTEEKPKKKFGFFRIGGKKSKDPELASLDSLHVRESGEFGSTASGSSLSESTERATPGKVQPMQQIGLNAEKENSNDKLDGNATDTKNSVVREETIKAKRTYVLSNELEKADGNGSSPKQHSINKEFKATEQQDTDFQQQNTTSEKMAQAQPVKVNLQPNGEQQVHDESALHGDIALFSTAKESREVLLSESAPTLEEKTTLDTETAVKSEMEKALHDESDRHDDTDLVSTANESRDVLSLESALTLEEKITLDAETAVHAEMEEAVISTDSQTKGPPQAAVDEEAVLTVYPDKHQVRFEHEQMDDITEDEKSIVEAVSDNVESQAEVSESLYTNIKGTLWNEEDSHKMVLEEEREERIKEEREERIEEEREERKSTAAEVDESQAEGFDSIYDNRQQSSYFDEENDFISSSKPSLSDKIETGNEKLISPKQLGFENFESTENFLFIHTIKEVKMSSTRLLAELAEINKKLQELKKQLLQVLKKGRDE